MFERNDKTALVTGATGGIGGGVARALHRQGATVAISGRQADKLEKLAAELGSRVHELPCDLAIEILGGDNPDIGVIGDCTQRSRNDQSHCRRDPRDGSHWELP